MASKKTLNGDSPIFTPGSGNSPLRKSSTLPLQAASAVPFTPRGIATSPRNETRADASAFNVATAREFVPRSAEQTPPGFHVALAKEFQPRGDRSPFNVAQAVEFRPQSQAMPPLVPSVHSSPEVTHHVQVQVQAAAAAAASQQLQHHSQQQQPPPQAPTQPAAHLNIPTGPAMSIPTGPSRGIASSHGGMALPGLGFPETAMYEPYGGAAAAPFNPYAGHATGRDGTAYFQSQAAFSTQHQPLNEHLYFPQGPHRQDLLPRQRTVHDFFLPEKLRQEIHMKSRAGSQAALTLSVNVEGYHSLSPLDTNSHKVAGSFGRITWIYKAVASKNGKQYCLRRLENFRVSNENALRAARDWRRVNCGSVVTVHEAFTTRAFGDSSVVFATDYFPLSVTLMQYHFPTYGQGRARGNVTIQESVLWGYLVQIANALKAIHAAGLAARALDLSKIVRTGKNRIRLSGCAVQDVINYDPTRRVLDLQQDDLVKFGEVMLALATYTPPADLRPPYAPMEQLPELYSHELRTAIAWLLGPGGMPLGTTSGPKNIDTLVTGIAGQMTRFFDMSLQENDGLTSLLFREVENGRVARMLMKLGTINERENYQRDATWAEHGPRYPLKLFRDYVFHQVDEAGRPVIDVWHMLSCLNKIDAGSNEVVRLSSRDGRTNLFVTYKELNKMVQRSFNDLVRASRR